MTNLTIASQLDAPVNQAVRERLAHRYPGITARGSASDIIAEFVLASLFAYNKRLPEPIGPCLARRHRAGAAAGGAPVGWPSCG